MSAYTPTKKAVPSWMRMNDTNDKHWMNSFDVDMEINGTDKSFTQKNIDDGLDEHDINKLQRVCYSDTDWKLMGIQKTSRACDLGAVKYPEYHIRHTPCQDYLTRLIKAGVPNKYWPNLEGCNMYSPVSKKIYPEYEKCLKPDAVDNIDCMRQCYAYPNQVGCETIVAGLSAEERVSRIRALGPGPKPGVFIEPEPETPPEETMVVAASMRSVSPTAINFAYMDPKTNKAVVVKKTLVDMYKPTDKVAVVLNKKTKNFVGLQKK